MSYLVASSSTPSLAAVGVNAGAASMNDLMPFAATGGSLLNSTYMRMPTSALAPKPPTTLAQVLSQRQLTYGPFSDGAARPYPVAAVPASIPAAVPVTAVGSALLQTGATDTSVPPTYFASAWSGGGRAGDRRPGAWAAAPYGYNYGAGYGGGGGGGCRGAGLGFGFP